MATLTEKEFKNAVQKMRMTESEKKALANQFKNPNARFVVYAWIKKNEMSKGI